MNHYMQLAVEAAQEGMRTNQGGPFGAVIVKDSEVIAVAHNEVLGTNDPTAHAEIVAVRRAAAKLGRFHLPDCEIYSTCELCPMCLAAIHWAGIRRLSFGADRTDSTISNFDDLFIYQLMEGKADSPLLHPDIVDKDDCVALFHLWNQKEDKVMY